MDRLLSIQKYILIILVLIFGGVLLLGAVSPGGFAARVVLSGSMEPAIPTGAVVFTIPRDIYYVDDVITFRTSNAVPTTHRIVLVTSGQRGSLYATRGDANDIDDAQYVSHERVYGKVLFHIPYLGFILEYAKTPIGFLLLVGVPALLIIVEEAKKIIAEVRRNRTNIRDDLAGKERDFG